MSSPIRPQFFCTRPNGTLTPLVAVDELPSHISIRGVPRILSASETQGMTSLGTVNSRLQCYVVEGTRPSSGAAPGHRSRDNDVQSTLMRLASDENVPASQRVAISALLQHGLSQNWFSTPPSSSNWLVPTNPLNSTGNGAARQSPHYNSKKEYCSYWIRHGECDYQQQGCLYKHEMPHDLSMLEKLGLRDIPRWYRDKYNIPSLLPNGHGHPRTPISHALPPADGGSYRPTQYHQRMAINENIDAPEIRKDPEQELRNHLSIQQPSLRFPSTSRLALPAADATKFSKSQRVESKQAPNSTNVALRKLEYLSMDSVPDYEDYTTLRIANENNSPAFDHSHSQESANYKNAVTDPFQGACKNPHATFSNIQSFIPAPLGINACQASGFPRDTASQGRSRKTHKSRRLYQPRSQLPVEEPGPEIEEQVNGASHSSQATLPSNCTSPTSGVTFGTFGSSQAHADPGLMHGCATSDPPSRDASPSTHSSTGSSESSPGKRRNRVKSKNHKPISGVIGQQVHRQRSVGSSEDDVFGLSMEEEK
ncbi:uncharacterized protein BP01DRAFT_390457 [Aspergillus saccharolyticus JOP 1030-1]|uniref:C3H1-type domain-containing protein n=1 Tax=Aspergillus saccharolyticus JOP 1030-1 TaxID=1450539 RepID=A0A318ZGV3_9EURO|nr:hypothetical protein BP01DRAFT_390457 [Aspergillus saccharolyticus JOP 1030-1]PYH46781.1 hypothetical protein BP01DRAFT_390457 [Aspergillus saccharolyticus JOP 1030-1]